MLLFIIYDYNVLSCVMIASPLHSTKNYINLYKIKIKMEEVRGNLLHKESKTVGKHVRKS